MQYRSIACLAFPFSNALPQYSYKKPKFSCHFCRSPKFPIYALERRGRIVCRQDVCDGYEGQRRNGALTRNNEVNVDKCRYLGSTVQSNDRKVKKRVPVECMEQDGESALRQKDTCRNK